MEWYDVRAERSRRFFIVSRATEITAAAAVPFFALLNAPAVATAGLGALIAVVGGFEQLLQFHENWINYRETCETLRGELFLHDAQAGAYAGASAPSRLLAERVAAITSTERSRWSDIAEQAAVRTGEPGSESAQPHG